MITSDEATSALDSGSEASVQRALADLHADTRMTMIIVAHRLSTVQVLVIAHTTSTIMLSLLAQPSQTTSVYISDARVGGE
jgi:ABC-type bacteriocin/lantibiotic exporter with double-glycine peptidase domain